ncbi:hypothetical protein [Azospirillum doebereinerae]|uniref:Uncharacterized protein n=1 Tax=Azospirillum doebereinerae TaxID=92933 RepID=A0A433JF50_9PROT|nr:hypothetical protein [Azospirillum doebereinerae]RUQ75778.1 hypothetical protein EJ913_01305 [Azospirillum doebereinerae]
MLVIRFPRLCPTIRFKKVAIDMKELPKKAIMKGDTRRTTFGLSSSDFASLRTIKHRYHTDLGFNVSSSIIVSLALQRLLRETTAGHLPRHPSMVLSRPW